MAAADDDDVVTTRVEVTEYPWHDANWSTLTRDVGRLPHALLFHGAPGLGKDAFALRLVRWQLCRQRSAARACGTCQGCALFAAGTHPDFLWIKPEGDSDVVKIDQVRGVSEFLSLTAHIAPHKVVLVTPADAMNVSAANSLLKILEEPPAGSLLILVASHLARVPATVRSRCAHVAFEVPARELALTWLRGKPGNPAELLDYAGGAPLAAANLAEEGFAELRQSLLRDLGMLAAGKDDPMSCAQRWKGIGADKTVDWLYRHIVGLIRLQTAPGSETQTFNIGFIDLMGFLDNLSITRRQLGTGLDEGLLLENCLVRWCEMTGVK